MGLMGYLLYYCLFIKDCYICFGKTGSLAFAFWIVFDFLALRILLVVAQSSWK